MGSNSVVVVRVPHGYTAGTIFLNRTRTRIYRTRGGYGYIPTRFWCGVGRNPRYLWYPRFLFYLLCGFFLLKYYYYLQI